MAYINQDEITKLRNSVDIVDIVGSYLKLEKQGVNYFAVCPFHDDHKPSMSVSQEKQIFTCWTCKESGNVFSFVEKYEHVSFPEAVSIVALKSDFQLSSTFLKKKSTKYDKYYEILDLASKFYINNLKTEYGKQAKEYLLNDRMLTESTINDFAIGLSLDSKDALYKFLTSKGYTKEELIYLGLCTDYDGKIYDHFSGRIVFPLCDKNGHIIGFTGRIYRGEKDKSKYVNTKETELFKKGELLYNYHLAKEEAKRVKSILVVEGQMDAIRLYSSGIKNVVATSGTALTKEQISLLSDLRCPVILCFDNDTAGSDATYSNGQALVSKQVTTLVIRISDAKDPDEYLKDFGKEKFENLIKSPLKYFDFKLLYLKSKKDMNNNVDVANYINEVLKELNNEEDPILKELTINKLANDFSLDPSILSNKLNKIPLSPKKEIIKEIKPVIKKDKYDKACERMLYLMMNNVSYLKMFQKKLGFIPIEKYRNISNEILYFYELNKTINLPDFISFIAPKGLDGLVSEIISASYDQVDSEEEMYLYIKIIKELIVKEEIKKLKLKLASEMDINKKMAIVTKIAELKKGSVEDE